MNEQSSAVESRPHVCFVALKCYGHLTGKSVGRSIGGAEVQQVMMARWLSQNGFKVSFITFDHGQMDAEDTDGITVYKTYDPAEGFPVLRFFARWASLWRALKKANADVYYQRVGCAETGQVALWTRMTRRPFVFGLASDGDCTFDTPTLYSLRERWLYKLGLGLANLVIAQTRRQQELLRNSMGMDSVLLRSSGAVREDELTVPSELQVLWVGRINAEKRLEWLMEIAAACPNYQFKVVGASNQPSEYQDSLFERAAQLPNLEMVGPVPVEQMPGFYDNCFVLCSTSVLEGFPNIYLEAWERGIPVLTAFDPDDVIAQEGLGWVCDSPEAMVKVLESLEECPDRRDAPSVRARQYFEANHTKEVNMPILRGYLNEVLDNP